MTLIRRSATTPSSATSNTFTPLEPRDYDARLAYVADLGVQPGMVWKGKKKPDRQQLSLGFEIIGETVVIGEEEWPKILWSKPFNIFPTMTDMGNELVYYKLFDPSATDKTEPVWEAQIGKPVNVTVELTEKEDMVYDNIGAVSRIPDKYVDDVGPMVTAGCIGNADDPENRCTLALTGLAKWCFDRRIGAPPITPDTAPVNTDEDVPY